MSKENITPNFDEDNLSEIHTLKSIFNRVAAETISDEQIVRLCAPIIKMIKGGMFDCCTTT